MIGRPTAGGTGAPNPLLATWRALRAGAQRNTSAELGRALGAWTLTPYGEELGFGVDAATGRLTAPDRRPDGLAALEVVGHTDAILPWFGEVHNVRGIGGAMLHVSVDERVSVRTHAADAPRTIRVFGGGTKLSAGRELQLCAAW